MKETTIITTEVTIGTQTTTGEEGQRLVQLHAAEAVVQLGGDDTTQDADELVADLGKGCRHLVGRDALDWATAPGLSRVVTTRKPTRPASAAEPSLSLDMP